jgi:hypothetical protein
VMVFQGFPWNLSSGRAGNFPVVVLESFGMSDQAVSYRLLPLHPVSQWSCWEVRFHGARKIRLTCRRLEERMGGLDLIDP